MQRKDYPNAAFGYVSEDNETRLLLHHDPEQVNSGKEHETVDPALLMLALELVDSIPVSDDTDREVLRRHLQMHANVILWTTPDTEGLPIALHDKLRDFAFFKANLDGVSEVPPVTTEARGSAYILYAKRTREMSWFVDYLDLSSNETAAHFHVGKSGKLGPIEIPVATGNPKEGSAFLSKEQEKQLFEGNMFFNIHSSEWPVGEIRGQVIPAAVSRSNNGKNPFGKEEPRTDKDKKKKKKDVEAAQVKPKEEPQPKPDLKQIHKQGDRGAVYNKVVTPPPEAKPKAQIYEGVQTEKDRKSGGGGPEVVVPPAEKKPMAQKFEGLQTEKDRKSGDGGPEVTKAPPEATLPKVQLSNRTDFAQPLVNIIIEQAPLSPETVKSIQESNTPTGVEGPPSITVSKLAECKDLTQKLTDLKFDGRLVILPITGNKEDVCVLTEASSKNKKSINNLFDSAFAVIERGGKKDEGGRTTPRDLRHLPHSGSTDNSSLGLAYLRNALARMDQIKSTSKRDSTDRIKRIAKAHLIRDARAALPDSKFAKSDQFKFKDMIAEIDAAILQSIGKGEIKVEAQLMEVKEESTVKLFRLKMGEKDRPITFFVRARFDENGKTVWVEFDFDTLLPASAFPDFSKFLKGLPT